MTEQAIKKTKTKKSHIFVLLFGVAATAAFFIVLDRSDIAIDYMKKGLKLCAQTVIPSLFPFMVISELMISCGMGERIGRALSKPMKKLFGVSGSGACAYLLGAVCGFPIGARVAVSMYDKGIITKSELERLMTFCNNPGSAFIISAIGTSLFGNRQVGILLYFCVILSSVTIGIFGNLLRRKYKEEYSSSGTNSAYEISVHSFTDAIQSSALSMLTVCAYVCFFSAFVGCIGSVLSRLELSESALAAIFGLFEISSGMGAAAELQNKFSAVILCAAVAGWSGLSVHFQIMTICSGRGLSFKYFFIAKAAQAILCAVLMALALKLVFPDLAVCIYNVNAVDKHNAAASRSTLACALFFLASVFPLIWGPMTLVVKKKKSG